MSKHLPARIAAACLCSAGLWMAWSQAPNAGLEMHKVKEGLWVISGDGGNVAVLPTSEGVILVDDKFPRDVAEITAKVNSISSLPIRYVVNTHHHGDHTGGNQAFLKSAEILLHKNARANLVNLKQPGAPRIAFADEASLFLGGKEVRARYYGRGHTDGDAFVYFPAEKVLHAGDMYVVSPFADYPAGGSLAEWTATLDRVMELDFDTVIPGHGPVSKREDFVAWRKSFEIAVARVKGYCGTPADEVKKQIKTDDLVPKITGMIDRDMAGLCAGPR